MHSPKGAKPNNGSSSTAKRDYSLPPPPGGASASTSGGAFVDGDGGYHMYPVGQDRPTSNLELRANNVTTGGGGGAPRRPSRDNGEGAGVFRRAESVSMVRVAISRSSSHNRSPSPEKDTSGVAGARGGIPNRGCPASVAGTYHVFGFSERPKDRARARSESPDVRVGRAVQAQPWLKSTRFQTLMVKIITVLST